MLKSDFGPVFRRCEMRTSMVEVLGRETAIRDCDFSPMLAPLAVFRPMLLRAGEGGNRLARRRERELYIKIVTARGVC